MWDGMGMDWSAPKIKSWAWAVAAVLAEDYLSHKHDWVQDEDEITAPIGRSLYTPGRKRSHSEHST